MVLAYMYFLNFNNSITAKQIESFISSDVV